MDAVLMQSCFIDDAIMVIIEKNSFLPGGCAQEEKRSVNTG